MKDAKTLKRDGEPKRDRQKEEETPDKLFSSTRLVPLPSPVLSRSPRLSRGFASVQLVDVCSSSFPLDKKDTDTPHLVCFQTPRERGFFARPLCRGCPLLSCASPEEKKRTCWRDRRTDEIERVEARVKEGGVLGETTYDAKSGESIVVFLC